MMCPVIPYKRLAVCAAIIAAFGFGYMTGVGHEKAVWQIADAKRAEATEKAIADRVKENAEQAELQQEINKAITKVYHEEINPVYASIVAQRVRIGPAICSGPAAPAKAESAGSGNAEDPPGRLVREDIERDFESLEARVEEALATGRACQSWVRANGFAPD